VSAAPGQAVPARLEASGYERTSEHVARLARVEWADRDEAPIAGVAIPGGIAAVFASPAVDLEAEARRTAARRSELEQEIGRAEGKLANEKFVARAPAAVVGAERDKLARLVEELESLA
jgi:valyl-tRNA synthetase